MNKIFQAIVSFSFGKILMAGILTSLGYWYSFYDSGGSLESELTNVTQQVEEQERKKKDTDATLKQEQEMKLKVGEISQKYQELSKKLPTTLFSNDVNRIIDEVASRTSVSVKYKKPIDTIKHKIVDEVPVEIKLEGSYNDLGKFCAAVASTVRITRVKNIVISDLDLVSKKLKFEALVVGYKLAAEESGEATSKEKSP